MDLLAFLPITEETVVEKTIAITPEDLIGAFKHGQKKGFIAGVVCTLVAKYYLDRRAAELAKAQK